MLEYLYTDDYKSILPGATETRGKQSTSGWDDVKQPTSGWGSSKQSSGWNDSKQSSGWINVETQTVIEHGALALEHAQVLGVADKYNIHGLKVLAATRFEKSIQSMGFWCTDSHIEALSLVLERTASDNNPLYNSVLEVLRQHLQVLFQRPKFEALIRRHPDLMLDLLRKLSSAR